MATRRIPLFAALGASTALWAMAPSALADPTPEDIAAARELGISGVKLAQSGDCKSAIPKLQGAEKLFHAPTTAEQLGQCQVAVGQLVAGTETLNRVVRETLAPNAPAAFTAAQQRAQVALNAALPKISQLKIHVDGAPADKVTVTVDDDKVPSVLFDSNRPTNPGTHQVKATAPGFTDAVQTVQLTPGGTGTVTLTLTPAAGAAPAVAPAPAPTGAPPPAPAQPEAQSPATAAPRLSPSSCSPWAGRASSWAAGSASWPWAPSRRSTARAATRSAPARSSRTSTRSARRPPSPPSGSASASWRQRWACTSW